jgi:hypothetical protein
MLKSDLLNDFSFYRRSIGNGAVVAMLQSRPEVQLPVSADDVDGVSMWGRQSLSMLSSFLSIYQHPAMLHLIANLCCGLLARDSSPDMSTSKAMLYDIMLASVIAYDLVEPLGAFHANSNVKVLH